MGRWTQEDEDGYRLPEGVQRIGYDADSSLYYFRDADGSILQSAAEFGEMTRVSDLPQTLRAEASPRDIEAAPDSILHRPVAYPTLSSSALKYAPSPSPSPLRTLYPFFLLVAVVLLLTWRLVVSPGLELPPRRCPGPTDPSHVTRAYWIQPGDTCWELAKTGGVKLADFKAVNKGLDCDKLMPGTSVCLIEAMRSPSPSTGSSMKG